MQTSYWEYKTWFHDLDYLVVGSGIVGMHCALRLRERFPKAKILILERGTLPSGASTKNAGFACFGSLSEILDDLNSHTEEEVVRLVEKRWLGLHRLRSLLGDTHIGYKSYGGYELFLENDVILDTCLSQMGRINHLLKPLFSEDVFAVSNNTFGFKKIGPKLIRNPFEGQIDTGKMMTALWRKCVSANILFLNGIAVKDFSDSPGGVGVVCENQLEIKARKLFVATNGFARQLLKVDVRPARAQVLLTDPIPSLHIKGVFHLDRGYYYFRNIDDRILFGGGRNLDFETEETTESGLTDLVQNRLETLLRETLLPQTDYTIARRWSGIMGMGSQKKPIVQQLSENVFCGLRLGGMGIAIGSFIGKETADLLA